MKLLDLGSKVFKMQSISLKPLLLIMMSLMVLLPSSSFFLSPYLTQLIANAKHNQSQLSYGVKHNNIAALTFSIAHEPLGSKNWLLLKIQLAGIQADTAYELGLWYLDNTLPEKSAEQQQLGENQAQMWFKQSIRIDPFATQGGVQLALASLYFKQGDLLLAQNILVTLNNSEANDNINGLSLDLLMLEIKILIALGHIEDLAKRIKLGRTLLLQSVSGRLLLDDLNKFKVLAVVVDKSNLISSSQQKYKTAECQSSLQLFASTLKHLKHLEQLQRKFSDRPLARFICLAPPRYLAVNTVQCNHDKSETIQCNEANWQAIEKTVATRHIGLMVEQGGANVHLGIMYFDSQDTVDVFSHEISHLLGFVDEYPLVNSHQKCQKIQSEPFAHNIVVLKAIYHGERTHIRQRLMHVIPWAEYIDDDTLILQQIIGKPDTWSLGTPEHMAGRIGLFITESCDNSLAANNLNFNAYKPIAQQTQLRYFTESFPAIYLKFLSDQPLNFLMPSFHYNLAFASYQVDALSQAKHWLQQATLWEKSAVRKEKISQGNF